MARKCPQGAICFETYTLLFLIIIFLFIIGTYVKKFYNEQHNVMSTLLTSHYHNNTVPHVHIQNRSSRYDMLRPIADPSISVSSHPTDTLMNPYAPPVQYNEPHAYRQVGYLKNESMMNRMLPLFARPVHVRRDKWYYYTIFDNIKVPVYYRSRKCTSTHGCDELYNGEIVQIEGMQQNFTVYLYDNHTLMYDPVI
jgi:hypothetical protein